MEIFIVIFEKILYSALKSNASVFNAMKIFIPALIISVISIWWLVKIVRFVSLLLKSHTLGKQQQPELKKAITRPAPKRPAPVQTVPDDSLERVVDRAFEKMGLGLRFGHLNAEARKMLRKSWSVRTPADLEENVRAEGGDMKPLSELMPVRRYAPERAILTENTSHFSFLTSHPPLQQWVVFNEILSPPLALREEK